jgi:hypothetical protein
MIDRSSFAESHDHAVRTSALRERLTQTLALVEVDQTFRKELGVGVTEFLQELNSSAIEDVSPAPAKP